MLSTTATIIVGAVPLMMTGWLLFFRTTGMHGDPNHRLVYENHPFDRERLKREGRERLGHRQPCKGGGDGSLKRNGGGRRGWYNAHKRGQGMGV